MPVIRLDDVTMIYPFAKVSGLFGRKQKKLFLEQQKQMPYTSNEGVVALQHFNAEIKNGEFVVVIGPSGSGKSTLLRIIAGLEHPSLGTVYFNEQDYNEVLPEDRDVAMVFQNYSLYPNQSVFENVSFPLQVKHMPRERIDVEVKKICGLLQLTDKLEKLPQDLSGGEKQRVAIARALVRKPSVLLLDEPFSNLDVLMRNSLRSQLKMLHREYGTTFLYVTHDQYDALSLAQRIIVLKDGIVQMDGSAAEVFDRPVNRFCCEFLSSSTMNTFGHIPVDGNEFRFMGRDHKLSKEQKKKLGSDRELTLCIRGNDISIADEGKEAEVEYAEVIEADLIIHGRIGGEEVVIAKKHKPDQPIPYVRGQKIRLNFDENRFHLFDADGERI